MEKTKKCYQFICRKFPECKLAAGSCCAIEVDEYEQSISEEECSEKNDYKLFVQKQKFYTGH